MASQVVSIRSSTGLPPNTELPLLYRMFQDDDVAHEIEAIYLNCNETLAVFKNVSDAKAYVSKKDDGYWNFGKHGQYRKLYVGLADASRIPKSGKYLNVAEYLEEQEQAEKVRSRTVLIEGLPFEHVIRQIGRMFKDEMENLNNFYDDEGYQCEPGTHDIVHIEYKSLDYGNAMVRFTTQDMADFAVAEYNVSYWVGSTIYVKRIPDSEMEKYLKPTRDSAEGRSLKLFVTGVDSHGDEAYIRSIFHPWVPDDINLPPGDKNFAFVFMSEYQVAQFFASYKDGKRGKVDGRFIKVSLAAKKGKGKPIVPTLPISVVPAVASSNASADNSLSGITTKTEAMTINSTNAKKTTATVTTKPAEFANDIRINGLAPQATKTDIRNAFSTSKPALTIKNVVNKDGYAFVRFESPKEVKRATNFLHRKKICGKAVSVEMVQPL
jgi:hypothetical protein